MVNITPEDINTLETELKGIKFDERRRNILLDNASFDVQACPGSGKTTLLASKLILLSKKWEWSKKGVCVLSHTNVAKDEIISRLKNHPTGWKFLKYPHFIGTIQEFVNRFLALPYCRDKGWGFRVIDNDTYYNKCYSKLKFGTRKYLERNKFCSLLHLRLVCQDGKLIINVPGFKKKSTSDSYNDLRSTKAYLTKNGFYTFREMYDIANANLHENDFLKNILRTRFPFIFIDEMQDTAKFQDILLNDVFPRDGDCIVQRFGDSDQAIFDGMSDEPNETFKGDQCKYRLPDSHRYTPCIANLIRGLSFSSLGLKTNYKCINDNRHDDCENYGKNVIFTYQTDEDALKIPEIYESHINDNLSVDKKKAINYAVGAIGENSSEDYHVRIDKYFQNYSKTKKMSIPSFSCLYESIAFALMQDNENVKDSYNLIIECVLKYIYQTDSEIIDGNITLKVNKQNLMRVLKENHPVFCDFNKIIGRWAFVKELPEKEQWETDIQNLSSIFNIILSNFPQNILSDEFWSYPSSGNIEKWTNPNNCNKVSSGEIDIVFSTIHGVKGQTHDSTLVLETNDRKKFDIGTLIENFADEGATKKGNKQNVKFMKQLFVGMSRPREILCLAVHEDSIKNYEEKLQNIGWKILPVT